MLCDGCDVAVHQMCYGVAAIPDGEWLCRPCRSGFRPASGADADARQLAMPPCIFCPCRGGALTPTTDGRWAHGLCTLWIPEAGYVDHALLEPVGSVNVRGVRGGIEGVPRRRFELRCSLCSSRRGAIVQCEAAGCTVAFHPMCAAVCGLHLKVEAAPVGPRKVQMVC